MSESLLSPAENHLSRELAQMINEAVHGTLAMLVDQAMIAKLPDLKEFANADALTSELPASGVMALVNINGALQGPVGFVFDIKQAVALANILVGGGAADSDEINDIQLGAVGEVVSQWVGIMASTLSQFMKSPVEISAPQVVPLSIAELTKFVGDFAAGGAGLKYLMAGSQQIPDLVVWQVANLETIKSHSKAFGAAMPNDPTLKHSDDTVSSGSNETAEPVPAAVAASESSEGGYITMPAAEESAPVGMGVGVSQKEASSSEFAQGGRMSEPTSSFAQGGGSVTVQPVSYPSFDNYATVNGPINKNLELVMDVCLNLTVELGRTEIPIKEILELTRGSVIELDKVAGEPVDLYANGKMIAKGEVVVIEDNFGLRITSIVAPAERIRGL